MKGALPLEQAITYALQEEQNDERRSTIGDPG
jgi:hypothetical protein